MQLGRYELGEVLGRGSVGVVHRSTDPDTGQDVAVKVLRDEVSSDPSVLARFEREAQLLARIDHPGVVRLLEVVHDGERHGLVLELVEDPTLRAVLDERGALADEQVARLGAGLLGALAAAHRAGIVHRDVKPDNVHLVRDGSIRLTDLGIGWVADAPALTRITGLIGTPDYLAPELLEGSPASPASDGWSAGVTLLEAATGSSPFRRPTVTATLRAIESGTPAVPVPTGAFGGWIAALLIGAPDQRPSCAEAASAFAAIGAGEVPPPPPLEESGTTVVARPGAGKDPSPEPVVPVAAPSRRRRLAWLGLPVVVVVVLLVALLSTGSLSRTEARDDVTLAGGPGESTSTSRPGEPSEPAGGAGEAPTTVPLPAPGLPAASPGAVPAEAGGSGDPLTGTDGAAGNPAPPAAPAAAPVTTPSPSQPSGTSPATRAPVPPPSPATTAPPRPSDRLYPNQVLGPNQQLLSPNGAYQLVMQGDGNLVLFRLVPSRTWIWQSNTPGNAGAYVQMQGDGNLVVYRANRTWMWQSNTPGNPGAVVAVQSDGNLVVYGTPPKTWIWQSNTMGR